MHAPGSGPTAAHRVVILALTVALAGLVYAATLRDGHDWGGDFAMYLMHARNLVKGVPYGETGYIVNPAVPSLGPETYPPVYPLLLAPIYALRGLDLTAMKLEIVCLFTLFLVVLCAAFVRDAPTIATVALVVAVAANPVFWEYKDHLMSDIPFLLFCYAALLAIERGARAGVTTRTGTHAGIAAGALVYLAYGTRQVGLVLLPCLLILDLIRNRRPTAFTAGALGVFCPLALVQTIPMHADSSYLSQISLAPGSFALNLLMNLRYLSLSVDNGRFQAPHLILSAIIGCLALAGYISRLRRGVSAWELFTPIYFLTLLLWTARSERFLFPLLPMLAVYAIAGLRSVSSAYRAPLRAALVSAVGIAVLLSYGVRYTTMELDAFRDGITSPEARELFAFVTASTDRSDVFVFRKPRVLTLFTDRRAAVYHDAGDDDAMWRFFDTIGARYLVRSREDPPYWGAFLDRQSDRLRRVYQSDAFRVYATTRAGRLTASGGAAPPPPRTADGPP